MGESLLYSQVPVKGDTTRPAESQGEAPRSIRGKKDQGESQPEPLLGFL